MYTHCNGATTLVERESRRVSRAAPRAARDRGAVVVGRAADGVRDRGRRSTGLPSRPPRGHATTTITDVREQRHTHASGCRFRALGWRVRSSLLRRGHGNDGSFVWCCCCDGGCLFASGDGDGRIRATAAAPSPGIAAGIAVAAFGSGLFPCWCRCWWLCCRRGLRGCCDRIGARPPEASAARIQGGGVWLRSWGSDGHSYRPCAALALPAGALCL